MCLHLPKSERRNTNSVKIAAKDIYVYKVFATSTIGQLFSPYRKTHYQLGVRYEACFVREYSSYHGGWVIENGLHAFADLEGANAEVHDWGGDWSDFVVRVAVIPKGSSYYRGKFNIGGTAVVSYASDALMVLKLDDPESVKRLTPAE